MKNIIILTGAGISAESGIQTFRDADGLWEGHDVMAVASPQGWRKDRALVLDFYNQRRRQLLTVSPNAAHLALAALEKQANVVVITQNVDDLHERAGSTQVIHLHGELLKSRSTADPDLVFECYKDINIGDKCPLGSQLRPHIVWFHEDVPLLAAAAQVVAAADVVVVVGSSMQVYPAAGLVAYAPNEAPVFYVDARPSVNHELKRRKNLTIIAAPATLGVPQAIEQILALP